MPTLFSIKSAKMVRNFQHQTVCLHTHSSLQRWRNKKKKITAWPLTWPLTAQEEIQRCVDFPWHINIYVCVSVLPHRKCELSWHWHFPTHILWSHVYLLVRLLGFSWNVCSRRGDATPSSPQLVCRALMPFPAIKVNTLHKEVLEIVNLILEFVYSIIAEEIH